MEYGRDRGERRSFGGGGRGGHSGGGSRGGYGGGGGGGFRGGGSRGGGGFVPVKEGEELSVVVESVAEKGDGVAKKQGFVIFVPGTKVGDKVKIRVKKVAKKVAFAEVIGSYEEGTQTEAAPAAEATEDTGSEDVSGDAEEQESEEKYDNTQDSEEF
ncbi:MAG: TRAM domain-containing protein [Candidatus Woesearchaeota archaeon]